MDDSVAMQVVKRLYELLGNLSNLRLAKVAVIFQDFEKLTLREFSDDTKLMRCLERIQQQDDVLMIQTLENLDLLAQVVHFFLCLTPSHCVIKRVSTHARENARE